MRSLYDNDSLSVIFVNLRGFSEKIPVPIKIKSAPPPLQTQNTPPPKRGILWTWRFSCRNNGEILGAHKIGAAISGPRIADTNFTDTRILLRFGDFRERKTHKHKQICGIVPGLGGCQKLFMCFFRVIPYGGEKTHKQNPPPPKSRDNPVEFMFTCFFLYVFLSLPRDPKSAGKDGLLRGIGRQRCKVAPPPPKKAFCRLGVRLWKPLLGILGSHLVATSVY